MSDISKITSVAKRYESSGDCSTVSDACGGGDLGGISYGSYQLASNAGSVDGFLDFARNYQNDALANYARVLSQYTVNSDEFIDTWRQIGYADPEGFSELQDAYAMERYYNPACNYLANNYYDVESKSLAIKACVFSRAIQYGSGNIVELFTEACKKMGYPNLSYVNDSDYDYDLICAIYDFLIEECDEAEYNGSYYHSPKDWCNGSEGVIYGLRNRFVHEKQDLLEML